MGGGGLYEGYVKGPHVQAGAVFITLAMLVLPGLSYDIPGLAS